MLTRPQPTSCAVNIDWTWPQQRVGIQLFGQGTLANNVFRDNLSADNAGLGFGALNPGGGKYSGNVFDRFTLLDNGSDAPAADGGKGSQIRLLSGMTAASVTDTCISPKPAGWTNGGGARLDLLHWPMQGRALAELGVDVEAIAREYIARAAEACN